MTVTISVCECVFSVKLMQCLKVHNAHSSVSFLHLINYEVCVCLCVLLCEISK
jgi:hypothetical protein